MKDYHGHGIGKKLFLTTIHSLHDFGYQSCCVFVLKDNPTIAFYRHFKPDFETHFVTDLGGRDYDDVGLGWTNLSLL